ncbi:hypothetical protein BJ684DRAFT_15793 [Piptocephalis cylindrospora]|uniref:Uncharacterized protein n=1 Tax=Piptocephalis cylindrospora TaxID=1907219 RepID=A0A4P9Y4E6_9FUNG|nr:hypothetical protein BJ684DRAFT_15793 [Piptocephalis cylindrospora]|eukprot:RKP13846.1 hypothetical protein BJ684DRAFT_15793 [Piptocephalis cylindrospora]
MLLHANVLSTILLFGSLGPLSPSVSAIPMNQGLTSDHRAPAFHWKLPSPHDQENDRRQPLHLTAPSPIMHDQKYYPGASGFVPGEGAKALKPQIPLPHIDTFSRNVILYDVSKKKLKGALTKLKDLDKCLRQAKSIQRPKRLFSFSKSLEGCLDKAYKSIPDKKRFTPLIEYSKGIEDPLYDLAKDLKLEEIWGEYDHIGGDLLDGLQSFLNWVEYWETHRDTAVASLLTSENVRMAKNLHKSLPPLSDYDFGFIRGYANLVLDLENRKNRGEKNLVSHLLDRCRILKERAAGKLRDINQKMSAFFERFTELEIEYIPITPSSNGAGR